ncbi:kinetochore Sim4 complex subunit FTA2-domain-containing protein [Xylaria venustula]|nr:kinetochore Sim4 complex subunit FTA2-domain-containing protein [Xylaria venustula]
MTPRRGASQPPALPSCRGPRLAPFQHQDARTTWIKRLGGNRSSESTTQGYVYKVEIKSKIYALKIVSRIKEARTITGSGEKLAIPCHGYLFLTKKDERWLRRDGISFGSRRLSKEYRPPHLNTNLVRAIVKDFERLNDIQVYNGDVRGDNFKGGFLVDFGTSQTEPHCLLGSLGESQAKLQSKEI